MRPGVQSLRSVFSFVSFYATTVCTVCCEHSRTYTCLTVCVCMLVMFQFWICLTANHIFEWTISLVAVVRTDTSKFSELGFKFDKSKRVDVFFLGTKYKAHLFDFSDFFLYTDTNKAIKYTIIRLSDSFKHILLSLQYKGLELIPIKSTRKVVNQNSISWMRKQRSMSRGLRESKISEDPFSSLAF